MLMEEYVQQLSEKVYDDPKKVFSIYLNMDPRDPDEQGGEWKIKLKNALNDLAKETKESDSHEEKNQSKEIRKKVEDEVYGKEPELKRSLLLFATADEDLWFSETLNIPVTTEFHWQNRPQIEQLEELVSQYPYTGILVFQQDQAQMIETEVGKVLETNYYKLNLDTDEWRQHQGPQGDDWTQGGAQRDAFKERVAAHQQRWFKSIAETVEKKMKKQGWKQLWLVGEQDEIEPLTTYFNQKIDKTVPRNLLNRKTENILTEVLENQ